MVSRFLGTVSDRLRVDLQSVTEVLVKMTEQSSGLLLPILEAISNISSQLHLAIYQTNCHRYLVITVAAFSSLILSTRMNQVFSAAFHHQLVLCREFSRMAGLDM